MAVEGKDLYDIALLIDDLRNEEAESRLNSMKNLRKIAQTLGPERTREELIPFLLESVDDEDEILFTLAEQLEGFRDHLGGPEHLPCLLNLLESLSTVEEPTVRDRAIESIRSVLNGMSDEQLTNHFVPMLRNLFNRDWFTSRISACALIAPVYPRLPDATKAEFRGMFGQLCRDDTPMVRRSAAFNLGSFAEVVHQEHLKLELLPLFKLLAEDDQDSVRLLAIKNVIAFGKFTTDEEDHEFVITEALELARDKSWRVRWSVANSFRDVCRSLGRGSREKLIQAYVSLLRDDEAEVRTAAAFKITQVATEFSENELEQIILYFVPQLESLSQDPSEHVRSALGCSIMGLAPVLGQEDTIKYLLPHLLSLLNDEIPDVRLNMISKLDQLHEVVPIDRLKEILLPSVEELANDQKWRIRLKTIEHIPLLASKLSPEIFDRSLASISMKCLSDEVFSIRQAATENLARLSVIFGEEWIVRIVIPRVKELTTSTKYLYRMQALRAVEVLISCPAVSKDVVNNFLIPIVIDMASDSVPNVRFNVAKCFERIYSNLDPGVVNDVIKPCLTKLANDEDQDVKYYVSRSKDVIDKSTMK